MSNEFLNNDNNSNSNNNDNNNNNNNNNDDDDDDDDDNKFNNNNNNNDDDDDDDDDVYTSYNSNVDGETELDLGLPNDEEDYGLWKEMGLSLSECCQKSFYNKYKFIVIPSRQVQMSYFCDWCENPGQNK